MDHKLLEFVVFPLQQTFFFSRPNFSHTVLFECFSTTLRKTFRWNFCKSYYDIFFFRHVTVVGGSGKVERVPRECLEVEKLKIDF